MRLQPLQINDGYSKFTDLLDTPSDYIGAAGKIVVVNGPENGFDLSSAEGGLTDGYLPLPSIETDPPSEDGYGRLYTKIIDGYVELHSMDDSGVSRQITSKGRIIPVTNSLWIHPANPHPNDLEFESTTFDAYWTEDFTVSGSAIDPYASFSDNSRRQIHTDREKSWYLIQPKTGGTEQRIYRPYDLPTNICIWTRGRTNVDGDLFDGTIVNNASFYLGLVSSSGGTPDWQSYLKLWLNFVVDDTPDSPCIAWEDRLDGGSVAFDNKNYISWKAQGFHYAAINKVGNWFYLLVFNDSGQMLYIDKFDFSEASYPLNMIVCGFKNASSLGPGNTIMGLDFIRFVESDVFLPGMHR